LICITMLAGFGPGGVRAAQAPEPPPSLPLVAALDSALVHFPTLAAARADHAAAHAAVGEARGPLWPAVELRASATQYEEPMIVTPLHGFIPGRLPPFDTTLFQGQLGASWTLFDGGARRARVRGARRQEDVTSATLSETELDVAQRVVDAYLDVLTGRAMLDAAEERVAALDAETDRTRRLRAAGRAADVEVLRAEASRAAAEAEQVRLAAILDLAERNLARATGLQVEKTRAPRLMGLALADTTPPDRDTLVVAARTTNAALAGARARLEAADASLDLARSARWPKLEAAGAYNGWSDDEGHDALEWNAGLQLAYPLFTGGAITKGVERAAADRRAADEELRLAAIQLEQDVDRGLARLRQAHARVRSLSTAVSRLVEVARIERLSLGAGAGTQTDYLRAEADLQDARGALAEARHGEMGAHAALARLTARLDRAWIVRHLEERP
jgi:outer membrane protein